MVSALFTPSITAKVVSGTFDANFSVAVTNSNRGCQLGFHISGAFQNGGREPLSVQVIFRRDKKEADVNTVRKLSEFYFIAVVEYAIDFCRRVKSGCVVGVLKVSLAARLNNGNILFHHHVLRASEFFDCVARGVVVPVRMTDEKNLDCP